MHSVANAGSHLQSEASFSRHLDIHQFRIRLPSSQTIRQILSPEWARLLLPQSSGHQAFWTSTNYQIRLLLQTLRPTCPDQSLAPVMGPDCFSRSLQDVTKRASSNLTRLWLEGRLSSSCQCRINPLHLPALLTAILHDWSSI